MSSRGAPSQFSQFSVRIQYNSAIHELRTDAIPEECILSCRHLPISLDSQSLSQYNPGKRMQRTYVPFPRRGSAPSELTQSDGVAPVTDFRYPTLRRWMPLGARHAGRYAPRTPRLAQRDTVHTIRAWCRQLAGSANSAGKACRTVAREVALRPAVTQHRAHVSQR